MKIPVNPILLVCISFLTACGGSDNADPNLQTGKISATPIENLRYRTTTQAGKTSRAGEFTYLPGESITFSIGHIDLAPTPAKAEVTLLDIAQTADPTDASVVNMSRLFQSLDDPADGVITISHNTDTMGCVIEQGAIDFTVPTSDFAANRNTRNLVVSTGVSNDIVAASFARNNLVRALQGNAMVTTVNNPAALIEDDPTSLSQGNVIDNEQLRLQRSILPGTYRSAGFATSVTDLQADLSAGAGGQVGLAIELEVSDGSRLSINNTTNNIELSSSYSATAVELSITNRVPTNTTFRSEDNPAEDPVPIGEFVTTSDHTGLSLPRWVDYDDIRYNTAAQDITITFSNESRTRPINYNQSLFDKLLYESETYRLSANDSACVSALGLRPDHFTSEDRIRQAFDIRTLSNAARRDTLDILRTACSDNILRDFSNPSFNIALKTQENFTLANLAGRFAFAYFETAFSTVNGEPIMSLYSATESMLIDDTGTPTPLNDYAELFAAPLNGGGTSGYTSQSSSSTIAPFTVPINPQTNQPFSDGQLTYNGQRTSIDPTITAQPAFISHDNNILLSHYTLDTADTRTVGLRIGFRLSDDVTITPDALVGQRFEVWGQRTSQLILDNEFTNATVTNLDGQIITFTRINDSVVANITLGAKTANLINLAFLQKPEPIGTTISSSPVTISNTGEIFFTIPFGVSNLQYRGFLSADGKLLFVNQGLVGTPGTPSPDAPTRTPFTEITNVIAGVAVGLPIEPDVATEILPGDFSIDLTGRTFTSQLYSGSCPVVPGYTNYEFTDTLRATARADSWSIPDCTLQTEQRESLSITELASVIDPRFFCQNHPTCTRADFNRLVAGTDSDDRPFVSTTVYDEQHGQAIHTKTVQNSITGNDESVVEVINLQTVSSLPRRPTTFALSNLVGNTVHNVYFDNDDALYKTDNLTFNQDGSCDHSLTVGGQPTQITDFQSCRYSVIDGVLQLTSDAEEFFIIRFELSDAPGATNAFETCWASTVNTANAQDCTDTEWFFFDQTQAQAFENLRNQSP